uniref:Neogenin 1 n=1 Tax=Latimeria chalumnae TaxID=7897 RepID=H3AQC0_LATCH
AFNQSASLPSCEAWQYTLQSEPLQVPGPAPNLQAYATSPTSITATWETPLSGNGEIQNYKLYYMEQGTGIEQDVDVTGLYYTINGLKKYTEYSFRVVALNKHGPGVSTQDVTAQTFSDVPSAAPQNLTVEVRNSKSILVQWQPPPAGTHNGLIVGYKIRYRKASRKSDSLSLVCSPWLVGLERGTEYSFRVAAMTLNGTGPATEWMSAETFESDLDETRVPDVPSSLHVRPLVTSIVVSWTPPENQDIVVRGYAIGYGIGSPHAQTIKVDYKQRYYNIENLGKNILHLVDAPCKGSGTPGQLVTCMHITTYKDHSKEKQGLYSLEKSLNLRGCIKKSLNLQIEERDKGALQNDKETLNKEFHKFFLQTNSHTVLGHKEKSLKLPTHLGTLVGMTSSLHDHYYVNIETHNGQLTNSNSKSCNTTSHSNSGFQLLQTITKSEAFLRFRFSLSLFHLLTTGYIVYYSTDVNAEIHDWVVEPVLGNRLTHQIQELTLDTTYYFKIQARNSKGMGPMSEAVQFRTPKAESADKMANDQGKKSAGIFAPCSMTSFCDMDTQRSSPVDIPPPMGTAVDSNDNSILLIIIVSVGVITIIIVVVIAVICTRRTTSQQKKKRAACKSVNGSHKYKGTSKDVKPPDLWIHHERLELKPIDKSPDPNPVMTDTPIPRNSQDITPGDSSMDGTIHQRRNSYRG